jgi:hypothetical protein
MIQKVGTLEDRIKASRENALKNTLATDGPPLNVQLPSFYIDRMRELGKKYRPIRWLPLDIPRIEFDNVDEFLDIWEKEKQPSVRIKPSAAEPYEKDDHPTGKDSSWYVAPFNNITLWRNPELTPEVRDNFWALHDTSQKYKIFDKLVEQVFEYYPIHTFSLIYIWQSTEEIIPHQDGGNFWRSPTEYRTMLYDENEEPTLYVSDIEHGDTHFIDLPKDTNSFCWSNGSQVHGSTYYGKRKFLLVARGFEHSQKVETLIDRSIIKYRDKLNYKLEL